MNVSRGGVVYFVPGSVSSSRQPSSSGPPGAVVDSTGRIRAVEEPLDIRH